MNAFDRMSMLELKRVRFAYAHERLALRDVDLRMGEGSLTCLVGPNGSGKSTLLRVAAGLLAPQAGSAAWRGQEISRWDPVLRARAVSFLPQAVSVLYRYRVAEMVAMGRHPHRPGPWARASEADRVAVEEAMAWTGVRELRERFFDELSGGERQRVLLAAALAQGGDLLLLDEPTAALDLHHQTSILRLLQQLARQGRAVLCATHDLNLAASYADRLVLLDQGQVAADGEPAEVLTAERLTRVYGEGIWVGPHPGGGGMAVLPRREEVRP